MKGEEVLEKMQTRLDGLTPERAGKLLEEKGENVLQEGKRKSTLQVFLSQFADLLVVILIIEMCIRDRAETN